MDWNKINEKLDSVYSRENIKMERVEAEAKSVREQITRMNEFNLIWFSLSKKIDELGLTDEERALWQLMKILVYTEGPLNLSINYIIQYLRWKEHHDIMDYRKTEGKYNITFDGLFEIDLYDRLEFLKEHGFDFMSKICPRKIRNAMAHIDFQIQKDGTVLIKKQKIKPSQLNEAYWDINNFLLLNSEKLRTKSQKG